MRPRVSGRERSVNKEQKSRLRRWFLLALLGLAGWIVFATWPRDLGEELRYAVFVGDIKKVKLLLQKHPELVNQTFVPSAKNQPLPRNQRKPASLNFAEEFTMFLWEKIVMPAIRDADPADEFLELEHEMLSPLQIAVLKKRLEETRVLLDHGADVKQPSWQGYEVTIFAANCGPEIMRLILVHGGQAGMTNKYGYTPLHAAVHNPNIETARLLLKAGANPNAQDRGGWTPLHGAVLGARSTNILELLIHHGARLDLTNRQGKTALDMALELKRSEAAEILARKQGSRQPVP